MPQLESALTLLESPEKRENLEKLFIDFLPDKCHKALPKEETGGDTAQETETEYDLGWHITLAEDRTPILISHNATDFRICLKGRKGWENLEKVLHDYCKCCYSNIRLKAEGSCLPPEIFNGLSEFLRETENGKSYVLAKKLKTRVRLYVSCVCHSKIDSRTMCYIKLNNEHEFICSIRPIVRLPKDIQIVMENGYYDGSTPERGLRIGNDEVIEVTDKEKRCAELRREIKSTKEHLQSLIDELTWLENS